MRTDTHVSDLKARTPKDIYNNAWINVENKRVFFFFRLKLQWKKALVSWKVNNEMVKRLF